MNYIIHQVIHWYHQYVNTCIELNWTLFVSNHSKNDIIHCCTKEAKKNTSKYIYTLEKQETIEDMIKSTQKVHP